MAGEDRSGRAALEMAWVEFFVAFLLTFLCLDGVVGLMVIELAVAWVS